MRIYAKSLRASTHSTISDQTFEINRLLIEKPDLFSKFVQPYTKEGESYPNDPHSALVAMMLILFEEIYFQRHKYGFIDKNSWKAWVRTMKKTLELPYFHGYWEEIKDEYPEKFRDFIDGLLKDK